MMNYLEMMKKFIKQLNLKGKTLKNDNEEASVITASRNERRQIQVKKLFPRLGIVDVILDYVQEAILKKKNFTELSDRSKPNNR